MSRKWRKWHLEHADGRRWTGAELDDLAVRLREETRMAPYVEACYRVCIDGEGELWLLGDYGDFYFVDDPDCVVVWDE